jgi:hypothetical protein
VSATARTLSVRRLPSLLLAGAVAVGLVVSLSACGDKPGAAAVVNGRRISVSEVQQATEGLRAADPTNFGKVTTAQVLSILIIGPYAEQAASAAGQGVSDDVVRQAVVSQAQQNGSSNVHLDKLNSGALQALRGEVALNDLDATGQQTLLKTIQGLRIQVSPRYGTFDRKTASIAAPAPNWLEPTAKPTATATASPSATG